MSGVAHNAQGIAGLLRVPAAWLCVTLAFFAGCARPQVQQPLTTDQITILETRVARDSTDVGPMLQLAAAYRQARRPVDATAVLERLLRTNPNHAGSLLLLGLTYEDLSRYADARGLYERYLDQAPAGALTRDIRARVPLVRRKELELAVRQAIANEPSLGPPVERAVAIFPFIYSGSDSTLRPLSRALAELLTVDLSQTSRITVLERLHVQRLLDELDLSAQELTDPASAVRSGRLLSAGRVVRGRIEGSETRLRVEAAVMDALNQGNAMRTVEQQDALARILDIEKRMAFDLYATLGIELTVAERELINRRPTNNIHALLAFGRGLEASDRADYQAAAREFDQAARFDRTFAVARQSAERATGLAQASATATDQLQERASAEAGSTSALSAVESLIPGASGRDAAPEVLGREGIGRKTILEILIRRN